MRRDIHSIIIQEGGADGTWLDAGDSAFTTGIMAFCGSEIDRKLMPEFITNNQLVRHPYSTANTGTAPHNDPKATSRDQVLAFFAGTDQSPEHLFVRSACLQYAKGQRVNSDVLNFANKFYLYKCAYVRPPILLYPFAYLNQALSILWDAYVKPEHEQNQSVLQNIVFGKRWIKTLYALHPDVRANITEYFSGWRSKAEIAVALNKKIMNSI